MELQWSEYSYSDEICRPANHLYNYIKHNFSFSITINDPKTMILYYRPTLSQQTESNLPNLSTNSISYSYSIDCWCLILFVSCKCINIIMISKNFILCVENKQVLKLFTIVLSYNKIMQFTGIVKCLIFYNLEIQPILKYSPNLKNLVES